MKRVFLALAVILFAGQANAKVVTTHVNGLVCAFCVTTIENSLKDEPGVKSTKVDMDAKTVTIDFIDGQEMSDEKLTETLEDAGYAITKIVR